MRRSLYLLSLIEYLEQIEQVTEQGMSQESKFRQIFLLKAGHLLAFFILIYVGVEARQNIKVLTCLR